jgi:hypothetical protein
MEPEISSEYSFMRVAYENLSQHFRNSKRMIEKEMGFTLSNLKKISTNATVGNLNEKQARATIAALKNRLL